jgi:hypothetical protein
LVCADPEAHEETAAECSGSFALLSYDALIIVMEKLHSEADVRSLACTSSHLRSACSDGLLWRVLFHRHFPASQLAAASLSDWRHAYMLEHSCNAELLRCYHSKATLGALDEKRGGLEVFGIPRTSYGPPTRMQVLTTAPLLLPTGLRHPAHVHRQPAHARGGLHLFDTRHALVLGLQGRRCAHERMGRGLHPLPAALPHA